jgi:hypothetical protein
MLASGRDAHARYRPVIAFLPVTNCSKRVFESTTVNLRFLSRRLKSRLEGHDVATHFAGTRRRLGGGVNLE